MNPYVQGVYVYEDKLVYVALQVLGCPTCF